MLAHHRVLQKAMGNVLQSSQNSLLRLLHYLQQLVADFKTKLGLNKEQQRESCTQTRWLRKVADNTWFSRFFMILIAVNMVAMAVEHDGQSKAMSERLAQLNTIIVYLFCVEIVVKVR
jgi:hypothetical protein